MMRKYLLFVTSVLFISACNDTSVTSNKMETIKGLNIDSISLKFSKYDPNTVLMSVHLSNNSGDTVYFSPTESEIFLSYSGDMNVSSDFFIYRAKNEGEIKESFMVPPQILSTDTAFKYKDELKNFLNANVMIKNVRGRRFICLLPNIKYDMKKVWFLSAFDVHKGFPKRDSGDVFVFNFELLTRTGICCNVQKILCSNFRYE